MFRKKFARVTPESVGIPSSAIMDLIEALEDVAEMHGIMIMRHGKICAEGWWAPFGPGVHHGLQSLTKTYAATAVGIAYTEGLLKLDEKLVDIFPEYVPENPSENLKRLNIYHVLTMSNGMKNMTLGTMDWIESFFKEEIVDEPGSVFLYDTAGSSMLGMIVRQKTGQSLHGYLKEKLFAKIGIDVRNIAWIRTPDGHEVGGGGMLATTEDNLRLMMLYLNGGVWENQRILAEDFVKIATTKQISTIEALQNGPLAIDHHLGYGFQIWMCQPAKAYRADGAFGQYSIVFPEQDMVISMNETSAVDDDGAQRPLDAIYNTLLAKLSGPPLPENPESLKILRKRMSHLSIEAPIFHPYSSLTEDLDGKTFKVLPGSTKFYFEPHAYDRLGGKILSTGISQFKMKFGIHEMTVEYLDGGACKSLVFAMDGTRLLNVVESVETPFLKVYTSAYWEDDFTLCLHCRWIESAYEHRITMKFDDPGVSITGNDLISLWPNDSNPVKAVRA